MQKSSEYSYYVEKSIYADKSISVDKPAIHLLMRNVCNNITVSDFSITGLILSNKNIINKGIRKDADCNIDLTNFEQNKKG